MKIHRMACWLCTITTIVAVQNTIAQSPVVASTSTTADERAVAALFARPVTVDLTQVSVKQALAAIAHSAHVLVQYQSQVVDAYPAMVTIHLLNVPLGVALERVLEHTGLQVVPDGARRVTVIAGHQDRIVFGGIRGTVTDATTKRPIAGVRVIFDDATHDVRTGSDGTYGIMGVSAGTHRVGIRAIGYGRQLQVVTVKDDQVAIVDFALEVQTTALSEVVVTGTIIPTELKAVPNAITVVTAKEIEQRGITHIDQLFRGDVPGLFAVNQGSAGFLQPGQVMMASRGGTKFSSFALGQPIKTYVDGVELADPSYLGLIDPKSIERIEILTGPQASTIYGSNAINGVMQVFTKRGTTPKPQLALNLLSGLIQNNFSPALVPQHDYAAQLSGVEGYVSYNAGSSWNYIGRWTPSIRTSTLNGFGGIRLQQGPAALDVSLRRTLGTNWQRGDQEQGRVEGYANGQYYDPTLARGAVVHMNYTSQAQTLGMTGTYTPFTWWSHTFTAGSDVTNSQILRTVAQHTFPDDTMLSLSQTSARRTSLLYTSTARLPATALANMVVTVGADGWNNMSTSLLTQPTVLSGTLNGSPGITRQPGHNRGAFAQGQLSVQDKVFLTYGLRAEWNPNYGKDATPNVVPRYGISYTQEIGPITTKVRGSYGHATRPPGVDLTRGITAQESGLYSARTIQLYGNFLWRLPNPNLLPESQRGGEGGIEVYWGQMASMVITRYNQTVNNLISPVEEVDSARSLAPLGPGEFRYESKDVNGYGYRWQRENLNIGGIRNQGWEVQSSANAGPLMVKGTYSWNKSRVIAVPLQYRKQFPGFIPGATFDGAPEHTYALGVQYVRPSTVILLSMQGRGRLSLPRAGAIPEYAALFVGSNARLAANNALRMDLPEDFHWQFPAHTSTNLNLSRRFSARLEGVVQIQNVTNTYQEELMPGNAVIGRQSKAGLRIRL